MHALFKRLLERSRPVFIAHYHCTSAEIFFFYYLVISKLQIILPSPLWHVQVHTHPGTAYPNLQTGKQMHGLHGEQLELCSHTRNQLARARCSWGTRPPPRSISFHSRGTSCSFWRRWLRKTSQLDLKAVHEGDTNISPYKREARRSTSQIKAT